MCVREGKSLWERGCNLFVSNIPCSYPVWSSSEIWLRSKLQGLWGKLPSVSPAGVVPFCTKSLNICGWSNREMVMQWPSGDRSHLAGGTAELQLLLKWIFKRSPQNGAASDRDAKSPASPTEWSTAWWFRCSPKRCESCQSKLLQVDKEIKPGISTPWVTALISLLNTQKKTTGHFYNSNSSYFFPVTTIKFIYREFVNSSKKE